MSDIPSIPLLNFKLYSRHEIPFDPQSSSTWQGLAPWQKFLDVPLVVRRERYEKLAENTEAYSTGLHRHQDFCAFYVVRSGSATHLIDNEKFLMARGDVYMVAPGSVHAYEVSKTLEVDAFYFLPEIFSDLQLDALRRSPGFWRLFPDLAQQSSGAESRWHLAPEQSGRLEEWTKKLFGCWNENDSLTPLVLSSLFFVMLAQLSQWRARGEGVVAIGQSEAEQRLVAVLEFCESHLDQELSVSQLASRAFLSTGRFTRWFQQHTGTSPAAFVRTLRIERAKTWLQTSELSVQEIAQRCGFRDGAHLSRVFKATQGQAPHQWRQRSK